MARKRGRDVIDETEVGAYHVWSRTVRRAFLTGVDPQTGVDYSYRKELIERRLETLASVFAIDCCDFTVLDNHLHLILRNRPDIVAGWSDEEVARRWLRLKRSELELEPEPTPEQIAEFVTDRERVAKRIEQSVGTSSDIPPVLERLGVTASQWEHAVTVTSRRFARELDIMAMMFAEARRRS